MNDVQHIISIIPIEVALDHRLTLRDIRVLIALYSFRGRNTDVVWPTRAALARRCGFPETRISTITSHLADLGWLRKVGTGGYSKATRYQLTAPDLDETTVTESVTVTDSVTDTSPATPTVTKLVTPTVTSSVTGKEHTSEHTKEQTTTSIAHDASPTFEEFWSAYPLKKAKQKAEQAWAKLPPAKRVAAFSDVPTRAVQDRQWLDGYIPHATTYLNGERWTDEIEKRGSRNEINRKPSSHPRTAAERGEAFGAECWGRIRAQHEAGSGLD